MVVAMDPDEIETFVVRKLGRYSPRQEIIKEMCARWGLNWPQAEGIFQKIEMRHGGDIQKRQTPFMLILSAASMLLGVVGLIGTIYQTLNGLVIMVGAVPWLGNAGFIALSISLIAGGAAGVWQALRKN